jgi:hypothetical protein
VTGADKVDPHTFLTVRVARASPYVRSRLNFSLGPQGCGSSFIQAPTSNLSPGFFKSAKEAGCRHTYEVLNSRAQTYFFCFFFNLQTYFFSSLSLPIFTSPCVATGATKEIHKMFGSQTKILIMIIQLYQRTGLVH